MTTGYHFESFYDAQYKVQGQQLIEWLRYCSVEKVNSIEHCVSGRPIQDVIEIGCGTGAILEEMNRRNFATNYWGIDLSTEALRCVRSLNIPRLRMAVQGKAEDISALFDRHFDLAVLSHVVEHVPDPGGLLSDVLRISKLVFVEVPIENTPGLKLKWSILKILGRRRVDNISGHIQFFSRDDLDALVEGLGARVLAKRQYVPMSETLLMLNRVPPIKRRLILALFRILGERMWARLWYSHYAVLINHPSYADPRADSSGPDHG